MVEKQQALETIGQKHLELEKLSNAIWAHPQVGYQETYACEALCRCLEENGFLVEQNLAGIPTAFCASYGSGSPVIGLLGEYDALPGMSQEAGCFVKRAVEDSAPGHGCGHNLLGVGSVAAALAVKTYLEAGHPGTVRFYGCPAEEGGSGKVFLARAGVFHDLDAALTWHPGDTNNVSCSTNLANCQVCYHFRGKASHAAISPELGRSALDAVELMNVGIQFLREHIPTDCRVHYAITNTGGNAPGIVQEKADVLYLMRAPQLSTVRELYQRVSDVARGAAIMTGTQVEAEFIKATSNIIINQTLGRLLQKNLEELGSAGYDETDRAYAQNVIDTLEQRDPYFVQTVDRIEDPALRKRLKSYANCPIYDVVLPYQEKTNQTFASSDVGDVSWVCPVAQISMVTMPGGVPLHSWQMVSVGKSDLAKKGMLQAGRVLAASAIDLYEMPELLAQARAELAERTDCVPYESPIPDGVEPRLQKT